MQMPKSEIARRLAELRREMQKTRLSACYITRREDVHYLSGFTGDESALLITLRWQCLITDFRYIEEAQKSAPLFDTASPPTGMSAPRFAGSHAKRLGAKRLGFASRHLPHAAWEELRRGFRGGRLQPVDDILTKMRARKSAWEIARIKAALACAEKAFGALRRRLKARMSEIDIQRELEWHLRLGGAEPAFPTIVACGANSSLPHAHAGNRHWRRGVPLLIDFGARIDFYHSDLTRVLFLGDMPRRWRERYLWVLEAQAAAISTLRPGAACERPDAAARAVFARHGCAEKFGHALGHGVGLAVHDTPRLGQRNRTPLQPGMVVTIEPALYYPGQGGIRIEDMALISGSGCRLLSRLPKEPADAVIG